MTDISAIGHPDTGTHVMVKTSTGLPPFQRSVRRRGEGAKVILLRVEVRRGLQGFHCNLFSWASTPGYLHHWVSCMWLWY